MSYGLRSRPYAIVNDLAIAAKNAAAKLRLGVAEGDWEDGVTNLEGGDPRFGALG